MCHCHSCPSVAKNNEVLSAGRAISESRTWSQLHYSDDPIELRLIPSNCKKKKNVFHEIMSFIQTSTFLWIGKIGMITGMKIIFN